MMTVSDWTKYSHNVITAQTLVRENCTDPKCPWIDQDFCDRTLARFAKMFPFNAQIEYNIPTNDLPHWHLCDIHFIFNWMTMYVAFACM